MKFVGERVLTRSTLCIALQVALWERGEGGGGGEGGGWVTMFRCGENSPRKMVVN
jgi:hypothetical protein